jgi:hypothetical protein
MGGESASSATRPDIDQVSGSGKRLNPEFWWSGRVQEHGAYAVVESAQCAFGLAILRRSVWAGEAKGHAMFLKIAAHGIVVKFSTIIGLQSNDR